MKSKLQSAMEYLMTYGWAILVIAVVLGVLYSLGIFSPSNFAPKAQPGSCQVFRPNGPGTNYDINLEGTCSGELPQYVAQFDGASSYFKTLGFSTMHPITSSSQISIAFWMYLTGYPPNTLDNNFIQIKSDAGGISYRIAYSVAGNGACAKNTGIWVQICSSNAIPLNNWTEIVYAYNALSMQIYFNGKYSDGGNWTAINNNSGSMYFFVPDFATGYQIPPYRIANVQIYNTSLSANDISALYQSGIGGSPIHIQNLIAWYPLNGNTNDYSGNNEEGFPVNMMYVGTWQGGYSAP